MDDGLELLLPSRDRWFLREQVESVFRQATGVLQLQIVLAERIDGFICFSEIDF